MINKNIELRTYPSNTKSPSLLNKSSMNYALGLKALNNGIALLSIFIQSKPKTMADVTNLYQTYYVGEFNINGASTIEDYTKEIRTDCKQLETFTEERPEDVEGYEEVITKHLSMAERCGLFDPNQYAYICTGTAGEKPELQEWKRVHLMPLFINITTTLINLRSKFRPQKTGESYNKGCLNNGQCGKSFRDIIQYPDKDKLLERLHELIDGKGGADVGAVLLNAYSIKPYLTGKPTQAEFKSEFELRGTWQAISNYMNENSEKALAKANRIVIFE